MNLCPSNTPSNDPDAPFRCALKEGHAVPIHQSRDGMLWNDEDARLRRPARFLDDAIVEAEIVDE